MNTITEALVVEHDVFSAVFGLIERVLPDLRALAEVKRLAGLVEGMLQRHAEAEASLVYVALDHVLQDQGEIDRLHQDHQEIDLRLKQVQAAGEPQEARRLLAAALAASRQHFDFEEEMVFPMIEKALQAETLRELAKAWRRQGRALGRQSV